MADACSAHGSSARRRISSRGRLPWIQQAPSLAARSAKPVGIWWSLTAGARISRSARSLGGLSPRRQSGRHPVAASRAGCHRAVQAASNPAASSPSWCRGKSSRPWHGSRMYDSRYVMRLSVAYERRMDGGSEPFTISGEAANVEEAPRFAIREPRHDRVNRYDNQSFQGGNLLTADTTPLYSRKGPENLVAPCLCPRHFSCFRQVFSARAGVTGTCVQIFRDHVDVARAAARLLRPTRLRT